MAHYRLALPPLVRAQQWTGTNIDQMEAALLLPGEKAPWVQHQRALILSLGTQMITVPPGQFVLRTVDEAEIKGEGQRRTPPVRGPFRVMGAEEFHATYRLEEH